MRVERIGDAVLYCGRCEDVLPTLHENSFDSICTDPPYHLGFMGKKWDGGNVAFRAETWLEAYRVLKPGGYMVAFSASRTFHRMVVAIEDAGFVIHPMLGWIKGDGFPKATRVQADGYKGQRYGGQVLKPALEPICLAQKPFSEKTGTANILKWGTGALNVDACRIPSGKDHEDKCNSVVGLGSNLNGNCFGAWSGERESSHDPLGRWPANVLHDGSPEVLAEFARYGESVSSGGSGAASQATALNGHVFGHYSGAKLAQNAGGLGDSGSHSRFFAECPWTAIDEHDFQRFFYAGSATATDRLGFKHPTVKPISLMRWLVRLITPAGGTVLDPFAGTFTTGQAALAEGLRPTGIEMEDGSFGDCTKRIEHVMGADTPLFAMPDQPKPTQAALL